MKKIILLTNKNEISKHYNFDEVADVRSFACAHGLDVHESDNAEFVGKIQGIRTEIKSCLENRLYENAAALRDKEWQIVMEHFACGPRLGCSSSGEVGEAMVYLTYNKINHPDVLK